MWLYDNRQNIPITINRGGLRFYHSGKQKDSYDHILKYTGLFGGVQGLNILIGVVRSKFVALILGPEGMGLVSLFNSTITLLSNTTDLVFQ